MKLYNSPKLVQRIFSRFTWQVPDDGNTIYLTFDDGPHPQVTLWILDQLANYNAKATFFCIGKNIEAHPSVFKEVLSQGHTIGNHTYSHLNGWNTPFGTYIRDVAKFKKLHPTKLFRPPYGRINIKQGAALLRQGYNVVMWSLITYDFDAQLNHEESMNNIMRCLPGNILVFHDSQKAQHNLQQLLPQTLEHFSQKGWQFKALPQE